VSGPAVLPTAVALLFALERLIYRVARVRATDTAMPADLASSTMVEAAAADLVIHLSWKTSTIGSDAVSSRRSNPTTRVPVGTARPVLDVASHASYPFVFEYRDEMWMVPETAATPLSISTGRPPVRAAGSRSPASTTRPSSNVSTSCCGPARRGPRGTAQARPRRPA
jgi:hypothetical protein